MCRKDVVAFVALSLAALLVSARARAAIAPDADAVVHRYLEATGGAAAFAAESTGYTHARIEAFGFAGTSASWGARPARAYSRTELGPFKLSEGVDGATAWRTDPTTGLVRPLADHDLDQALIGVWFEFERWAEPGQGGGQVTVVGHDRDSLGTVTVLEVTPPDGSDQIPSRRRCPNVFREEEQSYAATRRVEGRRVDRRSGSPLFHDRDATSGWACPDAAGAARGRPRRGPSDGRAS